MKSINIIIILSLLILFLSVIIQIYYIDLISYILNILGLSNFNIKENISVSHTKNNLDKLEEVSKDILFTPESLKEYDGKDGSKGLYLALLGNVYNVDKGRKYYGPGGGYEFFSGKDASRAFVTGDFTDEGLIDDVSGLSPDDYLGLNDWAKFYGTEYQYVGKLIGRYFDEKGEPTSYKWKVEEFVLEAQAQKSREDKEKLIFPPCNSEWSPEKGSRVYCTKKSGGIARDWVGVPRRLRGPGGAKERCACVRNTGAPTVGLGVDTSRNRGDLDHPNLREYEGCDPRQDSCFVGKE